MEITVVNLASKLELITDHWSPKVAGELNGQQVKLAKFRGDFIMHKHDEEDELFLVIDGQLFIEMQDKALELNSGEFVIIPRGVKHKPYAPKEVSVLMFEPATTLNTGDIRNERTVTQPDRI